MRVISLFLCSIFISLLANASLAQGRPASVQTAPIETREMTETVTVFGQIVAVRESAVATRVAGVVNDVPIQVGTVVAAGDTLAEIDKARLGIEMASAEAQLSIATAGLEVAQTQVDRTTRAFERAEDLSSSAAISGAQLDDRASDLAEAQGMLAQAQARIGAAENAIALAEYNLTNATIAAPFDGIVLNVSAQPGQFASAGSLVATLLDTGNMEVEANVPTRFVGTLGTGAQVMGKTGAGDDLTLTLRSVLPTEFSETRTRPVRFTVTEISPNFAIGQPVTLDLPIGESREVLVVPKDALVQARGGWTAFVNDGGKASPRSVTIGAALDDAFEVISGLTPGDEVVVRGNERLRPGQDIMPAGAGGGRPGGDDGGGRPSGEGGGRPAGDSEAPAAAEAAPDTTNREEG